MYGLCQHQANCQMITCSDFAKSMSLPCNSKNTLRYLTLVKQNFDTLPFLHHLPRNLSNPLVLKFSDLRSKVFCCAQRTSEVSLVTMLTLDGFGRQSETISAMSLKLSGI